MCSSEATSVTAASGEWLLAVLFEITNTSPTAVSTEYAMQ